MDESNPKLLAKYGYRRISRKFGHVSRVDRPDWFEWMNKEHFFGRLTYNKDSCWEDHYRRCYSKDVLVIKPSIALKVPESDWDYCGYVEKEKK